VDSQIRYCSILVDFIQISSHSPVVHLPI